MRIQIRVINQTARELAAVARGIKDVDSAAGRLGASGKRMGGFLSRDDLERYGKNLQWTGRQIEYNFTLPLVMAGTAATKFALDNERAFVRLQKVYDGADSDLSVLRRGFRALSDTFGVHQNEVTEIGAAWAAAGAKGYGLAKATRATLETMILGDLEATKATEALIAIQAQYGVSSTELTGILAQLNAVENETAVSFGGLIDAFSRAAGTARTAGIDARNLASLIAAITPAAGSAAQAGNALRTIISRIMAPTKDASDLMERMGLNIQSAAWQSKNGTERILEMAKAFDRLDDSQKLVVSSYVASRYQISRFDVLMRALIDDHSMYARAQKATEGGTAANSKVMKAYNREIGIFLGSAPQAFKILTTRLQNLMAEVMVPLLPAIIGVLSGVVKLVHAFTDLDPGLQKLIIATLLGIAAFGTLQRYLGATILLYVRLAHTVSWAAGIFGTLGRSVFTLARLPFSAIATGFSFIGSMAMTGGKLIRTGMQIGMGTTIKLVPGAIRSLGLFRGALALIPMAVGAAWTGANRLTQLGIKGLAYGLALAVTNFSKLPALMSTVGSAMSMGLTRGLMLVGVVVNRLPMLIFSGVKAIPGIMARVAMLMHANMGRIFTSMLGLAQSTGRLLAVGIPKMMWQMVARVAPILAGPWGIAIAAGLVAVYLFRDKIADAIRWVVDNWRKLPGGIVQALTAVVNIIKTAAMRAYEWMSYLNPFARHSPSLVEQVNAGVALISRAYGSLANIGQNFRRAINDLEAFKNATSKAMSVLRDQEFGQMRADAIELDPSVGSAFDRLRQSIDNLYGDLYLVGREFAKQEGVVQGWKEKLDAANAALDIASDRLNQLKDTASRARDELDAAKDVLDTLTDTPITGMKAMSDAIFDNEMAQKRLRLEMLRWEEVNGPLEDIENRLAALAGEVESLRSTQAELRQAGAGSDITGFYDNEINMLEQQARAMEDAAGPARQMQDELAKLQRQGEILDLENSLQFDPLLRQIEDVTKGMTEMPFDELIGKITAQQNEVTRLTAVWDQADAAVREQQKVVDSLQVTRDGLQASYDKEKAALDSLGESYDAIEAQIRAMEQALQDFSTANQRAKADKSSPAMEAFDAAAGGNFEDVGGTLAPESGDLEALVKQWEADSKKLFSASGMFDPIKDMWNKAWAWVKENVGPKIQPVVEAVKPYIEPIVGWIQEQFRGGFSAGLSNLADLARPKLEELGNSISEGPLGNALRKLADIASDVQGMLSKVWDFIGTDVMRLVNLVLDFFKDLGSGIWNELQNWAPLFGELLEAIANVWGFIVTVFKVNLALVLGFWKAIWPVLIHVLKPIFDGIVSLVVAALQIIRGIITMVLAIINGDWERFWDGMKAFLNGVWDAIYAIVKAALGIVVGVIRGIIETIVGIFQWLYDKLVGHSIIPDLVEAIVKFFEWLWDKAKAIWNGIKDAILAIANFLWQGIQWWFGMVRAGWEAGWNLIKSVAEGVWNGIKWVVENAINGVKIIINTVLGAIKSVWETIWGGIAWTAGVIWGGIRGGFDSFISGIKGALEGAVGALGRIWEGLKGVMASPINWIIENVINKFLSGVENIASALSFKLSLPRVPTIKTNHEGGVAGEDFTGKRRLDQLRNDEVLRVLQKGEGIIPKEAMGRIGRDQFDALRRGETDSLAPETGGAFDWVRDRASSVVNGARNLIAATVRPMINAAMTAMDNTVGQWGTPGRLMASTTRKLGEGILDWIKGVDDEGAKVAGTIPGAAGMAYNRLIAYMQGTGTPFRVTSTYRPGSVTASGNMSLHSAGTAADFAGPNPSRDSEVLARIFRAFAPVESQLAELIYAGPQVAYNIKNGQRVPKYAQDIHHDHVHAALYPYSNPGAGTGIRRLYRGGIVRGSEQGTLARIGDRRRDEAVLPLPNGWQDGMGGNNYNFYGDLEFPNVRDGGDAESFLRNLETLAS